MSRDILQNLQRRARRVRRAKQRSHLHLGVQTSFPTMRMDRCRVGIQRESVFWGLPCTLELLPIWWLFLAYHKNVGDCTSNVLNFGCCRRTHARNAAHVTKKPLADLHQSWHISNWQEMATHQFCECGSFFGAYASRVRWSHPYRPYP